MKISVAFKGGVTHDKEGKEYNKRFKERRKDPLQKGNSVLSREVMTSQQGGVCSGELKIKMAKTTSTYVWAVKS